MGRPMAKRLIDSGHELTVWNRSPQAAEALRAHGATVAATPRTAVSGATVIITMLTYAAALSAVLTGLEDAVEPGTFVVDMSTVGPLSRWRRPTGFRATSTLPSWAA